MNRTIPQFLNNIYGRCKKCNKVGLFGNICGGSCDGMFVMQNIPLDQQINRIADRSDRSYVKTKSVGNIVSNMEKIYRNKKEVKHIIANNPINVTYLN